MKNITTEKFIFGLIVVGVLLFTTIYFTDQYSSHNSAYAIGGAIGAIIGALFISTIIWGTVRLIRGTEKAPDMKKFLLYGVFILTLLYLALPNNQYSANNRDKEKIISMFDSFSKNEVIETDDYYAVTSEKDMPGIEIFKSFLAKKQELYMEHENDFVKYSFDSMLVNASLIDPEINRNNMANAEYIIKSIKRIKNETLKLNNHMLETLSKREDKVGRDMYKGFIKGYERGQKNMEVFFNNRLKLMQSVLAIQELVLNSPDDFIIENETLIIEDEYLLAKFNDLINQYNHYLGEDVVIQEEASLKLDKSIEKIKNQ